MKNRTKFLTLALLVLTILLSCKKESSENSYYVKFKMNGQWISYTKVVGELGPDLADNTKTDFGLTGNNSTSSEVFDISIQVDGTNLPTGTYNSDAYFMPIIYVKNANTPSMVSYSLGSATGKPDSYYEVTLTSITDKVIKGHFTGNYLENDFTDDEIVEITEGDFVIPRIR